MPEETELRPTPETDDAARKGAYMNHGAYPETSGKQIVHIEFARRLERQRDEARAQRDRLLEAVSLALRTNGGPIDGADTLNGEAYVMVRACAFADLEAATAEVEGRR